MKSRHLLLVFCALAFLCLNNVARAQSVPFVVSFWYPTNGEGFIGPTNIGVHALVTDSNIVKMVQYFSGTNSVGIVSNTSNILLTNTSQDNPFFLDWSNVPAGTYTLTAVATDSAGAQATSVPVTITVSNPPPPKPEVYIYSPTNNSKFYAPTNLTLYARAVETGGTVATVTFVANNTVLGVVSNETVNANISSEPLYALPWSNVPVGSYALTAIATDLAGNSTTSSVIDISVTNPPVPVPFVISFYYPTNGEHYLAPATVGMHALVTDSNIVKTVQFFAGTNSIGIVNNISNVLLTTSGQANPFLLNWSNVLAGTYVLTAVATDSASNTATSAPVTIVVTNPVPLIYIYSPTNNSKYYAPANLTLYARAAENGGTVATVTFEANNTVLGVVTNQGTYTNISSEPLYALPWPNVPVGNYALTAIVTDVLGNSATSAVVNILVTNPPPPVPFVVSFYYPTNGESYVAPADIGLHAMVTDSNVVRTVQYFAGTNSVGIVSNTSSVLLTNSTQANPFFFAWSNVAAGTYVLTAVATDSAGAQATSAPVTIYVLASLPPVVTIYAPDPVASYGTNCNQSYPVPAALTNYCTGSNTATFLVRRNSGTNASLTVYYAIGGTASNGVDYVTLPGDVTIGAGSNYALITIVPLGDPAVTNRYQTVILSLLPPPTNAPPTYSVGTPQKAGAVILDMNYLPMMTPQIHNFVDGSVHLSLPGTNGLNFCLESSADLINWQPVCTNTVFKGSAHYVDPDSTNAALFYRIVASPMPASY